MEINGDTMTLLATDRYRLAMREIKWNCTSEGGAVLCPLRAEAPGVERAALPGLGDPARIR